MTSDIVFGKSKDVKLYRTETNKHIFVCKCTHETDITSYITKLLLEARIDEIERINGEGCYSDWRKRNDGVAHGIDIEDRLKKLRKELELL